ncbi:MAG: hypothetical protein JOZ43_09000 [Acidobacteriales bacterium]|nr:hypothetical protein [Terriglobales bacterium]
MPISQTILPEFEQEIASTRKLLALVPFDKPDFKPHEKSMTIQRLASHIAELPNYMATPLTTERLDMDGSYKPWLAASSSELLSNFDKNVETARKAITNASDADWHKIWTFTYNGAPVFSMPVMACYRTSAMNHLIHHRAQLGVYLRLRDIAIPGMYGPSNDEMKFWDQPKEKAAVPA